MRKILLLVVVLLNLVYLQAQQLDTNSITHAERLLGLQFTTAEKDSMLDDLKGNVLNYQKMRGLSTPNALAYPFAFQPAPAGFKIPSAQQKINWPIPSNTILPANRNELAYYSLPQLASLIKYKKISSVELTQFFIERLKKWGDTLEAVITLTEELAMAQARAADEEIKSGKYRGPLHGIPYGLKDLFSVKGYKTTWGSVAYKDQIINEDAYVYSRLRNAGAVLCAKLTLGELANGDLWFGGRTKNPWNLKGGSSGSSAGSAAAVSAGLLPFAIGTETYGSIVSPSHACGVTGLRPTFGSISRSGAMVLSWSLDKIGPICRSAEDAAIVFHYIKGTDGKDASAIDRAFNYTGKSDLKKLRIGYAVNYFRQLPKTLEQWEVIDVYRKLGADVKEIEFPDSTIYTFNMMDVVISAESSAAFDELTRSDRDSLLRRQNKAGWPNTFRASRFVPAVEYINANRQRSVMIEALNTFMKNYDIIIVPSFSGSQLAITNLTGHPVVCMPLAINPNGRPNSITLIGNLYDEATLLAVAKAFQDATPHNKAHPAPFKQ